MAKYIDIPIDIQSPAVEAECSLYYLLQYKLSGDVGYSSLPITTDNPIRVTNLSPSSTYNFILTRYCCNGDSKPTSFNHTTGA